MSPLRLRARMQRLALPSTSHAARAGLAAAGAAACAARQQRCKLARRLSESAWHKPTSSSTARFTQEPHDEFHGLPDHEHGDSWLLSRYWDEAFQGALGPLPDVVTSACCSEFVVHRTRILARPRAFYMHVRWAPPPT